MMIKQKIYVTLGLLGLLSLVTACSTITGIGSSNAPPPTPLASIAHPQPTPKLLLSKDMGVGTDGAYLRLTPAWVGEYVYTVDVKGQVCSLDRRTGRMLWCKETKTSPISGVGEGEGILVFATRDSKLIVLDRQTGQILWTVNLPNQVLAVPTVVHDKIIVKTIDGTLCAFERCSGHLMWKYEHASPVFMLRESSSPQLMHDRLVVGFSDGKLAAYRLDRGELIWETSIATPAGRGLMSQLVDISADPVSQQNVVFVVTYQGNLAAVNVSTGKIIWQQPVSSYVGMAVTPQAIIVSDADSGIEAFDKQNGLPLWRQEGLKYRTVTAPVQQGCNVVVADKFGYLHWLSIATGQLVARVKVTDEPILSSPMVDGRSVAVVTQDGTLFIYS